MDYKTRDELILQYGLTKAKIKKMERRGLLVGGYIMTPGGGNIAVYTTPDQYNEFLKCKAANQERGSGSAPLPSEGASPRSLAGGETEAKTSA